MRKRPLCLAAMLLTAGILAAYWLGISWVWRSPAGQEPEKWAAQEYSVQAEGIVWQQEEKTYQEQIVTYLYLKQTNLFINSKKYSIRNIRCEIRGRQESFLGCGLRVKGVLTLPQGPDNPGEFDRVQYERSRKVDFYLKDAGVMEQFSQPGAIKVRLDILREKCKNIIREIFPQREAGVLEAMLLGEKELLDEEVKLGFQAAGISHIMAISGLHISMLGIGLWNGLRWLGLPLSLSSICSFLLLLGYGALIGSPTTAVRAVIMFGLVLGAKILGRTYDILSALAAAGILLLLDNPDLLFDSGFQMSFLAVVGMGTYGEVQKELWKYLTEKWGKGKRKHRKGKNIGENLVMGLSLWIFMLPVVLHAFYQVSAAGILCNLLALPLMPAVLGSGFLALILGHWGAGWGSLAGIPAYGIVRLYIILGELAQQLPLGVWTPGKPDMPVILIYYGSMTAVCWLCGRIMKKGGKKVSIAAAQCTGLFILLGLMAAPWKNTDKITVLDVGQGDGIVLQTGSVQALVDGGSTSKSKVGKYVILPFLKHQGISRLEGIFLTHTDQDHTNGVKEVLTEAEKGWMIVEQVFMPAWMKDTQEGKDICLLAEKAGAASVFLKAGDTLTMGKAKICVLHPEGDKDYSYDANGGSLVFTWELENMRAVFTGDLPMEEEENLIGKLSDCDVLKVAHHGSRYSTSEEFLDRVNPQTALISCGENNRYGHPGKETVERLEERGSRILRTDEQGALIVTRRRNGWSAEGFR